MLKLYDTGVYYLNGELFTDPQAVQAKTGTLPVPADCAKNTMAYAILKSHNQGTDMDHMNLKFDSMTSHDITYVGIIQTARASGMTEFPMPYVLTNCHNSLCAVGGTINEDDHKFALSAAKKYGGIYVPTNMAVIHSYNREVMAGCGKMILGSDSHTRYGALGTLAVGEGGGELAKQLLGRTYDFARPGVVAVYLTGEPKPGIGPHDVALQICGAVYANGYVKNKVMEFVGPGIKHLPMEFRNAIDVMTTETTCWSSIWETDGQTEEYFAIHGRPEAYRKLQPSGMAYYDGCIYIDLSTVESTIAMPMHPSYTYTIHELQKNAGDILREIEKNANEQIAKTARMDLMSKLHGDGNIYVDQGLVAGCSGGTFDNLVACADILRGRSVGNGAFTMSVYPGSMPAYLELTRNGCISDLAAAGVIIRECFCGPCFGAGDCPASGEFSVRHTTRNFPNREGSKPGEGQMSAVALMDARSIAATAVNGGRLTAAGVANDPEHTDLGSTIFANMPGDGSAREQAASCQRVMGANANFAKQYATKRYRSNCINWGMVPFLVEDPEVFALGDYIFVPGVRQAVMENTDKFPAYAVKPDGTVKEFTVSVGALTEAERQIITDGCLINYYRNH